MKEPAAKLPENKENAVVVKDAAEEEEDSYEFAPECLNCGS